MRLSVLLLSGTLLGIMACGSSRAPADQTARPLLLEGDTPADVSELYRRLGLIASPAPLSFVGKVASFATASPDTSLVLVSLSIPNRSLTFAREGERYRSPYEVKLVLLQGTVEAASLTTTEIVRVGSFREINRTDESVIFQHYFWVRPGAYTLTTAIRDVGGSRSSTQHVPVTVPAFGAGRLSGPVLVYEAAGRSRLDTIPRLLPSPRSSAVFGRDSTVAIYVEAYGPGARLPLDYIVRNDRGAQLWRDSATLSRNGALFNGIVSVPISAVGIGVANVSLVRRDTRDSVQAPLFVSFGEDIPLMSFEEMLGYLRYFTSSLRLGTLRDAPPERRATVWAEFLRMTDRNPETATNEEMQAYFARINEANIEFRTDQNPGWLSDRGMVYVALGEPDQILERNVNQTFSTAQTMGSTRVQIWLYREFNSQLAFFEESGGRWKLTRPSESTFMSLNARKQAR